MCRIECKLGGQLRCDVEIVDDFENGEGAQKYTKCFAEAQHLQEKGDVKLPV
jgi:hypothetical protein